MTDKMTEEQKIKLADIELSLEDFKFVSKMNKKDKKEALREARGLDPKEKSGPFGKNFFKKK